MCFAHGSGIATEQGVRKIETLQVGDKLMTRDHGLQAIRWIGKRHLDRHALDLHPQLRPILIAKGALGGGLPARDLMVSPQHRMVVRSRIVGRMFQAEEVFVAAKHLVGIKGVSVARDVTEVIYYHLLCDNHEIVRAEGAYAETLFAGPQALKAMTPQALREITLIFGEVPFLNRVLALPAPKGHQARKLVERHIKNACAVYS